MIDLEQLERDREQGTPGPWMPFNMVHADRGDQMTPEEIGEYVTNSVRMGKENHFLFISGKHDDGGDADVCHVGNGPKGAANARRIARLPDLEAEYIALRKAADELALWVHKTRSRQSTFALAALDAYREATK